MSINFLPKFDGTGRKPRNVQVDALSWLSDNWDKSSAFAISAPVAIGKSALAKSISIATGAHIITPTNILISQYSSTYPASNYLKGKTHYMCSPQMSCYEWVDECEQKPCESCPYVQSKKRAENEPTFFNPMSYWFYTFTENYTPPQVLVVDEAHTLISSLLMICGMRLRFSEYRFPKGCNDELTLVRWLDKTIEGLDKLRAAYKSDRKKYTEISKARSQMKLTVEGLRSEPESYAIWSEEGKWRGQKETFLNIKPLKVPEYISKRMLACEKLVLMSGTLLETTVKELIGLRPYLFKDLPSPIDKERRQVVYAPVSYKMNWETKPSDIAASITSILKKHDGQNTIVHVSYDMSVKLKPFLAGTVLTNTPETKDEMLSTFKEKGGIFLASGCAEGIDLKGDLARINIIPKLLFPNLNDPVVKKRMALADGQEWYALVTLQTLIQQTGRTTRDVDDYSTTYILDPGLSRLYSRWKHKLPAYFKESIQWVVK